MKHDGKYLDINRHACYQNQLNKWLTNTPIQNHGKQIHKISYVHFAFLYLIFVPIAT